MQKITFCPENKNGIKIYVPTQLKILRPGT